MSQANLKGKGQQWMLIGAKCTKVPCNIPDFRQGAMRNANSRWQRLALSPRQRSTRLPTATMSGYTLWLFGGNTITPRWTEQSHLRSATTGAVNTIVATRIMNQRPLSLIGLELIHELRACGDMVISITGNRWCFSRYNLDAIFF